MINFFLSKLGQIWYGRHEGPKLSPPRYRLRSCRGWLGGLEVVGRWVGVVTSGGWVGLVHWGVGWAWSLMAERELKCVPTETLLFKR